MNIYKYCAAMSLAVLFVVGCASTPEPYDYTDFRAADPKSLVVLPVLNETTSVTAPEFFLSTVSKPFAERGYYIFPANMVKSTLERDGLADASLVHGADTRRIGNIFDCDAAVYISIERWDSQYLVINTTTTVDFTYQIRSCHTGESLWEHKYQLQYSPQAASSGNIFADLIIQAAISAAEKAAPNYIPLAQEANLSAASAPGRGLPSGPYLETYKQDMEIFPVSASGADDATDAEAVIPADNASSS